MFQESQRICRNHLNMNVDAVVWPLFRQYQPLQDTLLFRNSVTSTRKKQKLEPNNRFVCLSWKLQNKQTCGLGVGNKQWYERTDREGGATLSKSRAEKISCCAAFNIYSRHQIVSVRCSLCVTLESCLCFSSSWKVGQSRNNKCLQRICFYKPLEQTVRV